MAAGYRECRQGKREVRMDVRILLRIGWADLTSGKEENRAEHSLVPGLGHQ
jgi:hypothetical protein